MDQYCESLVSMGVPKEAAEDLAANAQVEPKDNPLCNRIYKDFREVMAKKYELNKLRAM